MGQNYSEGASHGHGVVTGDLSESASRIGRSAKSVSLPPLSYAQERLWFLEQLHPGGSGYSIPHAIRLEGYLNVAALERSLNEVRRRHEVLRTTFAVSSGRPVQVVSARWEMALEPVDLSGYGGEDQQARMLSIVLDDERRPFDLSGVGGPLFRASLLRLGVEDHVLLLTMHHIVSDGWSIKVLFSELESLYEAHSRGLPSPLPELQIQYKDFAIWQRQWLQGEVLQSQLSYWKQQLGGSLPILDLPTDKPRPAVVSFEGSSESITLSATLSASLREVGNRHGCTLFMTVLGAFQTLLHRYTGQDDIIVGSPIANRNRAETENLIGFFVNTLALRADLSGDPSFVELLGRVREVALGAYSHQDLPFEKLVEELHPERDMSHSPLFQVMLSFNDMGEEEDGSLFGLGMTSISTETETTLFDLTLSVQDAEQLSMSMEYRTDLFEADTIIRMLGHFAMLLEGIVANPDRRLSELPILTGEERHQLLVEWNETDRDYGAALCVHEMFEAQARRTPDQTAAIFEGQSLTYRELDERSNRLANRLRGFGVGPEVLVGICVERSLEMLTGILGILKAGGAYVPLDPIYPAERLEFMLSDTRAPVVLTQKRWLCKLSQVDAELIALDEEEDPAAVERQSRATPPGTAQPSNLAYVIYTSGSTGTPKGVALSHAALCNYLHFLLEKHAAGTSDKVLQFASISFDAATEEIFMALTSGATLVVRSEEMLATPQQFLTRCEEWGVTVLDLPTAYWHELTNDLLRRRERVPPCIRFVLIGGEASSAYTMLDWGQVAPHCGLTNGYGPTETAVVATTLHWSPFAIQSALQLRSSIGRPIANAQSYILDRWLNPVPVGVPGELYIGGAGLARGYLNQPELTESKFIRQPDSLLGSKGDRLYRTGDLVRYLPDGNIEFLGRLDHQVKVRGFRIELGEVESALSQFPGVTQAAVVVQGDGLDKVLVAYVVLSNAEATITEIQGFLGTRLPQYMLPSRIIRLDALPLTASGKVDRKALRQSGHAKLELGTPFIPPRNELEEHLTQIWKEVLDVEKIGVNDNFFQLGGHSLLATQVVSRLRDTLTSSIPLRDIFEAPTIAQLAERLDSRNQTAAAP